MAEATDRAGGRGTGGRLVTLALPALGSLIAEPLYLLVDTAIVGHLGTEELGALGIAGQVLVTIVGLCIFLAYGTTTVVARATTDRERSALGVQGLWLATLTGVAAALLLLAFAGPMSRLAAGGATPTAALAEDYLRVSAPGIVAQLIALAGQGWLRGREQLGLALLLVAAAQPVNLVATLLLAYPAGLGLTGAALGTVVAQLGLAGVTVWLVLRSARRDGAPLRPSAAVLRDLLGFGGLLLVRSASLAGSYLVIASLAARVSVEAVAAHQIGIQLLTLGALALDALAIAAQVLVAAALGAGDLRAARQAARSALVLSTVAGAALAAVLVVAGPQLVTSAFSPDPAVARAAAELWPWLAVLLVLGGPVFALDGILIGAQDGRVLALAMAVAAAAMAAWLFTVGDAGSLAGLWIGLAVLFVARGLTLAQRILRGPLHVPHPSQ